jgi:type II secretory pathway pseudopilin PulG
MRTLKMNSRTPFSRSRLNRRPGERGYILLALLLTMALLSIGLLTMSESIAFQIRRDREEEFIHRGVQYTRAVRKYVKQFGRYPTSIDALENSNNMRFLRKRYKDPITGKDFKLLYYEDLETFYPPNQTNSPPGSAASVSTQPMQAIAQTNNALSLGSSPTNTANNQPPAPGNPVNGVDDATAQILAQLPAAADSETTIQSSQPSDDGGGRAIIGVTSYSKHETIRVFNRKSHYNEWQFVYDPSTDTSLPTTPNRPLLSRPGTDQPVQSSGQFTMDSSTNSVQK